MFVVVVDGEFGVDCVVFDFLNFVVVVWWGVGNDFVYCC